MDKQKLIRFFNKQATDAEVKEVLAWLYSTSFEEELDQVFSELADEENFSRQEWREYAQLKKMKERMRNSIPADHVYRELNSYNQKQRKKRVVAYAMKIAAAVSLLALSTFLFVKNRTANTPAPAADHTAIITKSTSKGQKTTIFLEDGSKVILNAQSAVRYPETFFVGERVVELEGEAFFEVAPNPDQPFIVKSGGIATTALGTSFNINTNNGGVIVSLVTGRVSVQAGGLDSGNYLLDPGEELAYTPESKRFVKRAFDPQLTTAWTEGIIYFSNAHFDEVITRLERWYGVTIQVSNRPGEVKHYTGRFINENLENVLGGIGFTNHFSYRIEGKNVYIDFQ